jgi:hypothetical protein
MKKTLILGVALLTGGCGEDPADVVKQPEPQTEITQQSEGVRTQIAINLNINLGLGEKVSWSINLIDLINSVRKKVEDAVKEYKDQLITKNDIDDLNNIYESNKNETKEVIQLLWARYLQTMIANLPNYNKENPDSSLDKRYYEDLAKIFNREFEISRELKFIENYDDIPEEFQFDIIYYTRTGKLIPKHERENQLRKIDEGGIKIPLFNPRYAIPREKESEGLEEIPDL